MDFQKLEISAKEIRQIDDKLKTFKQQDLNYATLLANKCFIMHKLNKTKQAIKLLLQYYSIYKTSDDISIVCLDCLIQIGLDISDFNFAYKYIGIKRKLLSSLDESLYYYDMILYYEGLNDIQNLTNYLNTYINLSLDETLLIQSYNKILIYCNNDRRLFYRAYDYLYEYYRLKEDNINLLKILYFKVRNLHDYKEYDEVIKTLSSFNKSIDKSYNILISALLIDSYYNLGDYRRAVIVESEYVEDIDSVDDTTKSYFVLVCKKLYEQLGNKKLIDYYNSLIKTSEKEEVVKKTKKIDLNKLDIDYSKEEKFEEVILDKEIKVSTLLIDLSSFFEVLKVDKDIKFRDVFRNYGIKLLEEDIECEMVLYNQNSKSYHYKLKRVYDKDFLSTDCINLDLINKDDKLFITNTSNVLNIVTNDYYIDTSCIIGFKMSNEASIIYTFKNEVDNYIYDKLKVLTNMLGSNLSYYNEITKYNDSLNLLKNTYDSNILAIKVQEDYNVSLNDYASKLFNTSSNLLYKEYLNLIDKEYVEEYKEIFKSIYNYELDSKIITYKINNIDVMEHIFACRDDVTRIISYIFDISNIVNESVYYKELSDINNIALIYNENKLRSDLINKDKTYSLIMFDIANISLYKDIYGISFAKDIIKAVSRCISNLSLKYNFNYYYLDNDTFCIVYNKIKDIRALKTQTIKLLNELTILVNDINHRLNVKFNCGCLRVLKDYSNVDNILNNLYDALISSKNSLYEDIVIFDKESCDLRFKDNQLILYVSEAIDNKQIKVKYMQVVDVIDNVVGSYYASLNLDLYNVNSKYFNTVINKRGLEVSLDKYLIENICLEEKLFYEETKNYFNVVIPIYLSSVISSNFIIYFFEKLRYYKIPSEVITIHIINDNNTYNSLNVFKEHNVKLATSSIDSLINNSSDILYLDVSNVKKDKLVFIKQIINTLNLDIVLFNVSDETNLNLYKNLGINKVVGDIFNKKFVINDLIALVKK